MDFRNVGKGRATGYSDFYKGSSSSLGSNDEGTQGSFRSKENGSDEQDRRKRALRRRLQRTR